MGGKMIGVMTKVAAAKRQASRGDHFLQEPVAPVKRTKSNSWENYVENQKNLIVGVYHESFIIRVAGHDRSLVMTIWSPI